MSSLDIFMCDDDPHFVTICFEYILTIAYSVAAISIILPTFIYHRSHNKESADSELSKILYHAGNTLFMTVFIFFILAAILYANYCYNEPLVLILVPIVMILHWIQSGILFLILFYRVYYIFHDTPFALSSTMLKSWLSFFIFVSIIWTIGTILYNIPETNYIGVNVVAVAGLCSAISTIWLVIIFSTKLINIHKECSIKGSESDTLLLDTATKTTLLCFISALFYMISMGLAPLFAFKSLYKHFVWQIFLIIDVYTSFLCVILSYQYFDHWYKKICKVCHQNCDAMWAHYLHQKDIKMMETNVKESDITNTSSTI